MTDLTLAILGLFLAQLPPAPRIISSVQGTVVNASSGDGLRKATVILRSADTAQGISYAEETDGNGHFQIDDLQPGECAVTADRQGFFLRPDGAPGAPETRLKIAAGDRIDRLIIKMARTGVITGRVLDQDGDPIRRAQVELFQYAYVAGDRQLSQVIQAQSKDKGEYRLFNLRPGIFLVRASPRQPEGAPTFFPSAVEAARATPIHLESGSELRGYDIKIRSEATHTVRVTPQLLEGVDFSSTLFPREGSMTVYHASFSGKEFDFYSVIPGAYVLLVSRRENSITTYARLEIEVRDSDIEIGELNFEPPFDIFGTIKIEGNQAPAPPALALHSDGPSSTPVISADLEKDGSFSFKNVAPGVYRINTAMGSESLYVKSIRIGDQSLSGHRIDLTKAVTDPLTVVLGADVGEIEGTVKTMSGEPAVHALLTLFPDGAIADRADFFKSIFSDDQGRVSFTGVAPGQYKLFAWQDVQADEPQDPDFRKRFEKQGTAIELASNGHETVSVTAISVAATTNADQ